MSGPDEREAWIRLAHAVEPGDAATGAWLSRFGPIEALARLDHGDAQGQNGRRSPLEGLRARLRDAPDDAASAASRVGARIITRVDAEWPTQLADLGDRQPCALWVAGAGSLRLLALRSIALVGARAATPYGEGVARAWAAQLASEGWTIVSGCAFGIDAAAHRGALEADGVTVAVLASGVDVAYPRAHEALLARILDSGLIVSEVPPGESARRQRFLARNRVIAALTRATVVVEAAARSGTSATARAAGDLGREVLAVPGPVTSAASAGCHRMIHDGDARIALDWTGVLDAVQPARCPSAPTARTARDDLGERELRVLDALPRRGGRDVEQVMAACGLGHVDVLSALGLLQAGGWAERGDAGWRATPAGCAA